MAWQHASSSQVLNTSSTRQTHKTTGHDDVPGVSDGGGDNGSGGSGSGSGGGDRTYRALAVGRLDGVSKEREAAGNAVDVRLAVLRLPAYATDLLVSLSTGVDIADASSAARAAGAGARPPEARGAADALLRAVLRSLRVVDYGLFGGGGGNGDGSDADA